MFCRACGGSDPASDVVKVDASAISLPISAAEAQRQEQERREAEEEEERRGKEEERRRREEAERAAARAAQLERRRKEEEEAVQRRKQAVLRAQEAARQVEEQRLAMEAREEKRREEQRKQEEAEREKQEREAVMRSQVETWLEKEGFKDVTTKKKFCMSACYPLHTAVKQRDADMISLLLWYKADPRAKNSHGKTPQDLAERANKKGLMDPVLAALGGRPQP